MQSRFLGAAAILLILVTDVWATAVDAINFAETNFLTGGPTETTGIAWAPDGSGRLFLTQKSGACRVVQHGFQSSPPVTGTLQATAFMTEPVVFTNSECGLLGVAFDPDFVNNHYVYFFVTVSNTEQQIVRYTDLPTLAERTASRFVIVSGLPTKGNNHDGGGIGIGPDGKIYWSIGDQGDKTGVDTNLTSLAAKIGRANRDGTIPNDNPFVDGAGGNNDYIWARGLRNPFTLTFQPGTGLLWLDDVGSTPTGQTNPNSGPGYEQIFIVRRGDHNGYDDWENNQPAGFNVPVIAYTTGGPTQLTVASVATPGLSRSGGVVTVTTTNTNVNTHPFRRGGRVVIAGATNTSFNGNFFVSEDVSHQVFRYVQAGTDATSGAGTATSTTYGNGSSGAAVSGGTFYDSTAFPAAYRGNYFFGDYVSSLMARTTLDAQNNLTSVDLFVTAVPGGLIDIATGHDGALYYQGIGSGTIKRLATTSTAQNVIVQPTAFNVLEGGSSKFTVRLAAAPATDVNVTVSRVSGDAELTVSGGAFLTFTPANFAAPQIVTIAAAEDTDVGNDSATFEVLAPGIATYNVIVNGIDNDDPQLVVSTASLAVNEASTKTFTVRLATPANLTVAVARTAGDNDVTVSGGSSLTFTTVNYATPQTVTISAANDADNADDNATITVSTADQPFRTVAVTVTDNDPAAPVFTSSPIVSAVDDAAYTYDANASGNPAPVFSFPALPAPTPPPGMSIDSATGVINWTPTNTGSFPVTVQASNGVSPIATQSFSITVNPDTPPVALLTEPVAGQVLSGTTEEFFGSGVDDVSTVKAEFFVDGVLRYTDTNNDNHFHFGGAHLLFDSTQSTDGAYTNGMHTLRMRVTDTKGQTGQQEVQVTFGNGGDRWRAEHFNLSDPTDLANSQFDVDPDNDGRVNLLEYFSDTAPKTADVMRLPTPEIVNVGGIDYLALRFVRANWTTDVQALVEVTGDFSAWTQIDPSSATYLIDLQNNVPAFGLQTFLVRDVEPMGETPRLMRLRVTRP